MPVGFNSPARNLFLLGSSGAQTVTNFFKSIDQSSTTDGVFLPDEIRYNYTDQKYVLAGSAADSNSKGFGWFEKRDEAGALDFANRVESTVAGVNTTLRAMELDSNNNLIVAGFSGTTPWIAKYSNAGVLDWQSTTNSANVRYTGLASDSNGNYYASGRTSYALPDTQAFVEKFDSNGNPGWGKSAFMLGRDVVLRKISANSRGEVVAVGFLEDDSADKGYIVKIDTNTGEVLWDRTLERNISGYGGGLSPDDIAPANVRCMACYIDSNDQIYVVGSIDGNSPVDNGVGEFLIKYSPEGNIIWQRERKTNHYTILDGAPNMVPFDVKSDGETEQTVVLSVQDQGSFALNNSDIFISKYSKNGDLVYRRQISKGIANLGNASLDADPSFYYILFEDQEVDGLAGTPDRYTFGKISTSGNGLGAFQYDDGAAPLIDYTIVSNAENKIGRLSDGSVRNDSSDLITYPFTANKLVFDDLATQVSNKKRQMDNADSFEYSGSPAIRPADFQELNLLGDTGFVDETTGGGSTTTLGAQTWSNDLTTANPANGFSDAATLAFDGGTNTSASTSSTSGGNQIVWSPSQFPAANGPYTLEVLARTIDNNGGWGDRLLKVNGTTVFDPAVNTLPTDYVTVSNLTEITEVIVERSANSSGRSRVDTIKVNGTELIDGQGITLPVAPTTTSKVKDQSGKGNDGVVNGATHNAAGYWEFDGVNDTINLGSTPIISSGSFTYEAWGWVDAFASGDECSLINYEGTNQSVLLLSAGSNFDGGVGHRFVVRKNNANEISIRGNIAANGFNEWHHYVGVYNDDTQTAVAYVDGVQVNTGTNTNVSGWTAGTTSRQDLGVSAGGSRHLDGRIGEARIYPRALTAAQVFQNYNATKSKYINEAPDTAPKIGPGIAYDSNLLLNYDFGNRATYDRAENLVRNSNDLNSTYWQIGGGQGLPTRTQDALSPVGDLTAWTVDDTATGADGQGMDANISGLTASSTQTYTMSVYAKQGTAAKFDMYCFFKPTIRGTRLSYTWDTHQIFTNGSDNGGAAPVSSGQEYVGNGWYRIWMEVVDSTLGTNTELEFRIYPASRDTGPTGSTLFWNPQVVKGSDPGRDIKTYGTAITAPTTVKNLSSSSYTGTINGGTTFNSAGYFDFDGVDGYIDTQLNAGSVTELTVEAWLRVDTYTNDGSGISIGDTATSTSQCYLGRGNSGGDSIDWRFYTGTYLDETEFFTSDTGWKHYVGTYDQSGGAGSNQGRMRLYVDGNLEDTALSNNTSAINFAGGTNIRIGTDTDSGSTSFFDGKFGEVRIYNRALSSTEVSQNFNATRGKYGV